MITRSVAFGLFRQWLDKRFKLRVEATLANARLSFLCTLDLISEEMLCLRVADAGFLELSLSPAVQFELVQPRVAWSKRLKTLENGRRLDGDTYEAAIVTYQGDETVTLMQLTEEEQTGEASDRMKSTV